MKTKIFGQPHEFFWLSDPDAKGMQHLEPAKFGRLFSYLAGSTIPHPLFKDAARTEVHTNPVFLDSNGKAPIFLQHGIVYRTRLLKADIDVVTCSEDCVTAESYDAVDPIVARPGKLTTRDEAIPEFLNRE